MSSMKPEIVCGICKRLIQRGLVENTKWEEDEETVERQVFTCFLCLDTPFVIGGVELPLRLQSAFEVGQMFAAKIRRTCSDRQVDADTALRLVSAEMSTPEDYIREHITYYEKHRHGSPGLGDPVGYGLA